MKPREVWQLDTLHLGRRVLVFDCLDSTSTQAALLADDPANEGVAVLAQMQTAGRGQHGRRWLCQPGEGVLLSVLLLPPLALRRPALLTAWAAVSVCEVIHQLAGLSAQIKWPNDVLIQGKKVCGILIEQARGVVVGIGLNVNQSAESFAEAGLPEAGSLASLSGQVFPTSEVARALLRRLDEEYARLAEGRELLELRWQERLGLLGQDVVLECAEGSHRGRLIGLSFDVVELYQPGDAVLRMVPERVQHILPDSSFCDSLFRGER
jgi:BirA family biotin operon repressor/biotin-[acetyl-CoA-carboxylase] ligase